MQEMSLFIVLYIYIVKNSPSDSLLGIRRAFVCTPKLSAGSDKFITVKPGFIRLLKG